MLVVFDLFTVLGAMNAEQDYNTEAGQTSKMKCFAKKVNSFILDEAKSASC